ncbi:MAG TPA: efflux RND transporter periplasmic adaptor subunit [Puia sp.]|nr:efflux RND transporter periplasmic adaptor subunit [Puia sp.]
MKYWNILFSGLFIAGILILPGCSGAASYGGDDKKDSAVVVVTARPSRVNSDGVLASGQVEAVHSAWISTRLMGTITKIYVKVGDKVRQGQLLVTIGSEEIDAKRAQVDAQIAGAQADLDNARKDYDRYNALYNKQSATASELDNVTLRLQAAKSRLEGIRQMRREVDASAAYARLTAPFAGVVTQKLVDEGSLAAPGAPILTVEQSGQLRVNATVAESDINRIRTGDKAELKIKSGGLRTTGAVTEISVSSVATGGQFQVKISVPQDVQKSLYAGMYVNVFIPEKPQAAEAGVVSEAVLVPASALVEKDQLTGIYTVSNMHTALLRWIRTGKKAGDQVEVLSGLHADEFFIVSVSGKLYDGIPVIEK